MIRNMLLPTLSVALLMFACKNKQASSRDAADPGTPATAQDTKRLGGPAPGDSLVIALERTPCFGMCPAYRFNAYRSGYATYEGVVHVENLGRHEGRVPLDKLQRAVDRANESGFFKLDAVYDSQVTDLPSTVIRVVADGQDKQVTGRVGTPASFKSYTTFLEEELLPAAWKPVHGDH